MEQKIKNYFINLKSNDDKTRMEALQQVMQLTEIPVDWVYQVWDDLFTLLEDRNSFKRNIAIMVLCNLAKSDVENRLQNSLKILLAHTRDEKFVTSRQCLLNIWKLALVNKQHYEAVINHLVERYRECITEDHYNLYRQDIIQSLASIYKVDKDEKLSRLMRALLLEEKDVKYRTKYATFFPVETT